MPNQSEPQSNEEVLRIPKTSRLELHHKMHFIAITRTLLLERLNICTRYIQRFLILVDKETGQ